MLYRIKQFYWDIISPFKDIDTEFVDMYLNNLEKKLFNSLNKAEQHHCIRVAKLAIGEYSKLQQSNGLDRLIKICLLHDIGKIGAKLNIFDRVVLVLGDKITRGNLKNYNNIKKINIYYNHAQIGARKLKELEYDDEFIYIIKSHHKKDIQDNVYLNILRFCDDKT